MASESRVSETRVLMGLRVPKSLFDLVEDWSRHSGHDGGDILRSMLNLGLCRYAELFPDSAQLLATALNDLDAMAPEQARHEKLHVVEQASGRLTLRQQPAARRDAVIIEVDAQPLLAALLKRHAERGETTIGEMLVWCWCLDALTSYMEQGDVAMLQAILLAWQEQGMPEHLRPGIDAIARQLFSTDTTGVH